MIEAFNPSLSIASSSFDLVVSFFALGFGVLICSDSDFDLLVDVVWFAIRILFQLVKTVFINLEFAV